MSPNKKQDPVQLKINAMRTEIRKEVEEELLKQNQESQQHGKYPCEGMWLGNKEIEKLQQRLKLRGRIVFAEVIALLLVLALLSYGLYTALARFFLPR